MKTNGLTKLIIFILFIVLFASFLFRDNEGDKNDGGAPPVSKTGAVGTKDSEENTVTTLIAKDEERKQEIDNLRAEIKRLTNQPNDSSTSQLSDDDKALLETKKNEVLKVQTEVDGKVDELNILLGRINKATDIAKNTINEMDGGSFNSNKNPLDNDYPIQGGNQDDNGFDWTYPLDQNIELENGEFKPEGWGTELQENSKTAEEDLAVQKIETQAVFTIPENSTLIGAKLASRIIAIIPKNGSVSNPMGFKVVVPAKILAANGFEIDGLKNAHLGGYAVGNYSLQCARGYITSFTFIFEDGRIAQVGNNLSSKGNDSVGSNTLAVLTDRAGTECVSGTRHSDAAYYIGTNILLGAASNGANALAQSQETVEQGTIGSSSSVTGDPGKFVLGESLSSGINQGTAHINQLWNSTTDIILVDIDSEVNIEVKQEIKIDYDKSQRKVVEDWSLTSDSTYMESFFQ